MYLSQGEDENQGNNDVDAEKGLAKTLNTLYHLVVKLYKRSIGGQQYAIEWELIVLQRLPLPSYQVF